jgi:hypothetical protein
MKSQGLSNELCYLELNVIYPSYNLVRMSDKGLIKLINSDTNRFVEKRFLKSLFKQIKPVSNLEIKQQIGVRINI